MCQKCQRCWTNPNFCPCNNSPLGINGGVRQGTNVEIIIRYSCPFIPNATNGNFCPNCMNNFWG